MQQLQMISDARSSAVRENVTVGTARPGDGTRPEHGGQIPGVAGKGYADTAPPPDVDLDCLGKNGPPPKTFSLYAHYAYRFDRAMEQARDARDEPERIRAILHTDNLCSQAIRDLLLYTGKMRRPTAATNAENVQRLLSEYRGIPAAEAAVWEMADVKWVKRSRLTAGVDPETGEERAKDARTLKILELDKAGMSQRAIAEEVGIGKSRVNQILTAA